MLQCVLPKSMPGPSKFARQWPAGLFKKGFGPWFDILSGGVVPLYGVRVDETVSRKSCVAGSIHSRLPSVGVLIGEAFWKFPCRRDSKILV